MNIAIIGYGCRGQNVTKEVLSKIKGLNIVSVCDKYEDCALLAEKDCISFGFSPKAFTDYRQALSVANIDAAIIFTSWETHCEIAVYAMEKGIPVASEVGGEYSLDNCYTLVRTQERTSTPYMFLENCCYGEEELLATSLVRRGKLGTVVACSGAYGHDLRNEIAYGHQNRHYRFDNYKNRCVENYPTHELGPIAKLLNINRGNRIVSLSSFASKSAGLKEYISSRDDATEEMKKSEFLQGDIVETILKCADGTLIRLTLDTTLPRSYSRAFTVRGTKGSYFMDTNSFFFDGDKEYWVPAEYTEKVLNNASDFASLRPDIWKNITEEDRASGHGGMDWFCYNAFFDALKSNKPMPIDVYDGALWAAIAPLSEKSIIEGGAVQSVPDFTNGKWITRSQEDVVPLL